jgi:protein-S-isoprenylcysteine O-methyltransferase Ste14
MTPLPSQESALCMARVVGIATGIGFVAMLFLYFRSGPQRAADRAMSVVVLAAAVYQYWAFFAVENVPVADCLICVGLLLLANFLFWSARLAHGSNRPAAVFGQEVPETIVRNGPYRLIRHPFYLAYSLSYLALAVVGGQWLQYVIAALLFLLYDRAASQEERLLCKSPRIGEQYTEYCRRSWRWCPPLW